VIILEPAGYDKEGPLYSQKDVRKGVLGMIDANTYFTKRAKRMSKDIDGAASLMNSATKVYNTAINRMIETEERLTESTKQVSSKVREAADKLGSGLARVEKQANFDRLERYVELLERAESAFSALAELEKSGKLEKIAQAVR
jgi:hypothetical protein